MLRPFSNGNRLASGGRRLEPHGCGRGGLLCAPGNASFGGQRECRSAR